MYMQNQILQKEAIDVSWNFKNTPGVRSIDIYKSARL